MDVTVSRNALLPALDLARKIANRKSTMPILANVLIRALGNDLSVSASDLTTAITSDMEAKVKTGGSLSVDAQHLYDVVKSFALEDIRILAIGDGHAEIRCGRSKLKLLGLATRDFPSLPEHHEAKFHKVPPATLRFLLDRTKHCISTDQYRPNLCGVHFSCDGKEALCAAADGYQAAVVSRPFEGPKVKALLVPKAAIDDILGVTDGADACEMAIEPKHVFLRTGRRVLALQPLAGEWPLNSLPVLFREQHQHVAICPRKDLLTLIDRATIVARTAGTVRLELAPGMVGVMAEESKTGLSSDEIAADYQGERVFVWGSAKLWMDTLRTLDSDQVAVCCAGPRDPVIFQKPGDPTHRTCFMPKADPSTLPSAGDAEAA